MSGYRKDEEALRARIAELEGRLGEKSAEVARLRGLVPGAADASAERSRVLGTPKRHVRETTLPFTLSDDGYATIARILRSRLGLSPAQVGGDLTAPGFSLTRDGGSTQLRIWTDFSARAGGVVAASVMSLFIPGLPIAGVLADIANHGGPHSLPFHALWLVPSVALGIGALVRARARSGVAAETARIDGAFEAILDAAREHAQKGRRVRVESAAEESGEEEPAEVAASARGEKPAARGIE